MLRILNHQLMKHYLSKQRIEDTPDTAIKEADSNEIQKASFKVGEKVAAVSGEYSDQVIAAM